MPYLVGLTGPYTDQIFEIKEGTTRVGRGPACDLVLDRDPTVSRAHATLVCAGGVVRVQDAGSTHGTYVNGRRVDQALLRTRDCVQFGASLFMVQPVPAHVSETPRLKVVVPRPASLAPGTDPNLGAPGAGPWVGQPSISPGAGCLFYSLALLLPIPVGFPIGLFLGWSYLRKPHPEDRRFGVHCMALSVLTLVFMGGLVLLYRSILRFLGFGDFLKIE